MNPIGPEKGGKFHFYVSLLECIISKCNISSRIYLGNFRLGWMFCVCRKKLVKTRWYFWWLPSNLFYVHPEMWGFMIPIGLSHIFFNWVGKQPPTRIGSFWISSERRPWKLERFAKWMEFLFLLVNLDMFFCFLKVGDVKHPFFTLTLHMYLEPTWPLFWLEKAFF